MKKDLFVLCILTFLLIFLFSGTKIQSVDDYYLTHIDDITEDSETVFLSIDCSDILDNWEDLDPALRDEKYVPSGGMILQRTEYVLRGEDTVFDILNRAARYHRIQMEYNYLGNFGSAYVLGINHLYEFSCGPLSGWTYRVNGEMVSYGSSKYKLADGDDVEWIYSCDLGRDGDANRRRQGYEVV